MAIKMTKVAAENVLHPSLPPVYVEVPGHNTSAPGLVVTPAFEMTNDLSIRIGKKKWHITHFATGKTLHLSFVDKKTAHRLARCLKGMADWTVEDPLTDNPNLERIKEILKEWQ